MNAPESKPTPPDDAGLSPTSRWLYRWAGLAALGLGIVGIVLPVLPTTPLVLVAAWFFARSSPRLHRRLLEHPRFGPLVRDWEAHGVIRLRAKLLATAVIAVLVGIMLSGTGAPGWTKLLTLALVAWGLTYVWTRPSRPPGDEEAGTAETRAADGS